MTAAVTETPTTDAVQGFHRLRVADVERLCEDAVAVTFDVPDHLRDDYAFRAGQYLTLRQETPAGEERRSYSICLPRSEALRRNVVRVGVAKVPGGAMSTWVHDELQVGDTVTASQVAALR